MIISSNKFQGATKVGQYYLSSKFKKYEGDKYYYLIGEIFNCKVEDLICKAIKKNKMFLSTVVGEFSLVVYDTIHNKILFVNDRAGRNLIFYSLKKGISIGHDFWSMVEHNEYNSSDVDRIELKTQIFFSSSPTHQTLIKGLMIFENATIAEYSGCSFDKEKYWTYKKNINSQLSVNEKFDEIDKAFNSCFKHIKKATGSNFDCGVGISGGIDSRLIPYYAKKNDIELSSFIIGEEKPYGIFKSNDHCRSDEIANYFSINHDKLPNKELTYKEKNEIDCHYSPLVSSQIFKTPNVDKCNFDILITGASGFIVGSSPFYEKNRYTNLVDVVFIQQSELRLRVKHSRYKKGMNYLFGNIFEIRDSVVESIPGLIEKSEVDKIKDNCRKFIDAIPVVDHTEKLMNYAISVLGQRNKSGAFESLLNRKRNYSAYVTYFIDVVSTWSDDQLYDRRLFENFLKERLPELAEIKQQNHKPSVLVNKIGFLDKALSLFEYIVRGEGVMGYNRWVRQKDFKIFVEEELKSYNKITEYLDVNTLKKLVYENRLNSHVLANSMKMNRILNMLD